MFDVRHDFTLIRINKWIFSLVDLSSFLSCLRTWQWHDWIDQNSIEADVIKWWKIVFGPRESWWCFCVVKLENRVHDSKTKLQTQGLDFKLCKYPAANIFNWQCFNAFFSCQNWLEESWFFSHQCSGLVQLNSCALFSTKKSPICAFSPLGWRLVARVA